MKNPSPGHIADCFVRAIAQKSVPNGQGIKGGRQAYAFTDTEKSLVQYAEDTARRYLIGSGRREGSDFRVDRDPIGNLLVTVYGRDRTKTVMAGSHLDSVLLGGNHDGVDGVASALAYLKRFAESGMAETNYTFTVFCAEESSPMTGEACLGSKVLTGQIPESRLTAITYGETRENRKLLSEVFGTELWDKILEERANPWVRQGTLYLPQNGGTDPEDMEAIAFNEKHIEQYSLLKRGGFHAGIVSAIGGSTNRRFYLDATHLPHTSVETRESPRATWRVNVHGKEAHTGGAPHNEHARYSESGPPLHRQDALVGTCRLLTELLQRHPDTFSISSVSVPKETGFTTVPAIQIIDLHGEYNAVTTAGNILRETAERIGRENGLRLEIQEGAESSNPLIQLDRRKLLVHLSIPLTVEETARSISRRVDSLFGGNVRGTITDARFDQCGVNMNLNTRDISPDDRDELLRQIRQNAHGSGVDAHTLFEAKVALTEHIPLDPDMVAVAEGKGRELNFNTLTMPSMPSHDAARMQEAGVPSGMIFVSHGGESHIATEHAGLEERTNALELQHAVLDHYTGRKD